MTIHDEYGADIGNGYGYRIVRFYRDAGIRRRVIRRVPTLTLAQAHCSDPETSSSTATGRVARARTRRVGAWFDGYEAIR